jgi:ElaB/YqjD/DUF883 family membrane-anchored ribosome-binding protein
MGMTDEMHNLCEDIVTSRFERGEVIKGINSDTGRILHEAKNIVEAFGAERKKMSEELRSDLKEAAETIKADTGGKLREFSDERAKMSKAMTEELDEYTRGIRKHVTDLLTDADNMMKGFAEERVEMGSAVRKELGEYTSGIKKDVGSLLSEFSGARMETVKELKKMHEEWLRMVKPRAEVKKRVAEEAEEVEVGEVELGELKDKVLEIITSCPHGISLTGIGLQLGVEWRKLIRPAKDLLEEGRIRKEDLNYFPLKEKEN